MRDTPKQKRAMAEFHKRLVALRPQCQEGVVPLELFRAARECLEKCLEPPTRRPQRRGKR